MCYFLSKLEAKTIVAMMSHPVVVWVHADVGRAVDAVSAGHRGGRGILAGPGDGDGGGGVRGGGGVGGGGRVGRDGRRSRLSDQPTRLHDAEFWSERQLMITGERPNRTVLSYHDIHDHP